MGDGALQDRRVPADCAIARRCAAILGVLLSVQTIWKDGTVPSRSSRPITPCRDLQAVESDVIRTSIIITSADINVFYHISDIIKSLNFKR
jgi:hypothetical protein